MPGRSRSLTESLVRGVPTAAAVLGVWCGLGFYLDSMFVITLAGRRPGGDRSAGGRSGSLGGGSCVRRLIPGAFVVGVLPARGRAPARSARRLSRSVPAGARPEVLAEHAAAPRARVPAPADRRASPPGFQADPDPGASRVPARQRRAVRRPPGRRRVDGASGSARSSDGVVALGGAVRGARTLAERAVARDCSCSSAVVVAGFVTEPRTSSTPTITATS